MSRFFWPSQRHPGIHRIQGCEKILRLKVSEFWPLKSTKIALSHEVLDLLTFTWVFTPTNPSCHRPSKPHTARPWKRKGGQNVRDMHGYTFALWILTIFLWIKMMQRKFSYFLMRCVCPCMPRHLETYVHPVQKAPCSLTLKNPFQEIAWDA
jgi:hypothetical protein